MEEGVYNALLKYAIDKEYQEGLTENEKRKIRRRAKQFVAKDTLLYFTLIDIRDNVFKVPSRNIKAAQEKQKRDYDRRNLVAEHSYTVGAKVLMKNGKNDHRVKDRELITENAIETVPSKLPGKVVNIDIN